MSIHIADDTMTSDQTAHRACPADPGRPYELWRVTWLPDRLLTRNQAVTAMTLAEIVTGKWLTEGARLWPLVDAFADELSMTGVDALARVTASENDANDEWMAAVERSRLATE